MKRDMRSHWLLTVVVFLLALMPTAVWAQGDLATVTVESSGTAVKEAAGNTNLATGADVAMSEISNNGQSVPTVALPQLESDKLKDTGEIQDAQIETQAASGDFEYKAVSGGVSITKYNGKEFKVTIPDTLDGKPVVKIGRNAFSGLYYASSVIVGKNVKTIESNAFWLGGVSKVTIPATTTEIATDAFMTYGTVIIIGSKGSTAESVANTVKNARFLNVDMMENDFYYEEIGGGAKIAYYGGSESLVIIPDTLNGKPVVAIGSGAVNNPKIIVGKNVKTIESNAFGSGVKELTIPATTTEIAPDAIEPESYYSTMVNIYGSKGSAAESFARGLDNARFLIQGNVENNFWYEAIAGGVKITYYDGSESPVIIPDTLNGKPVVTIGSGAVYNSKIIVGKNVKTIESNAFISGVKELTIPATTMEIAPDAIKPGYSSAVANIYGTKGSAADSFARGLDKARFLDSGYEENGFWYEEVSGGVKVVYYNGSESPVIIPDTFKGQPVVEIGSEALTECYRQISIVGNSVGYVPNIIVGNNVKVIDSNAFCSYVRRLTIPKTTTDIAADAITNKYQSINIFGSQGSAAESFARGFDSARFLAWEDEQNNFWVEKTEGGVKIICYDDSEEEVTIPSALGGLPVVAIGKKAFADCNILKEVTIPDSVTQLEDVKSMENPYGIFSNCNSLEKITVGKGVSEIPFYFAYPCTNLKEVVLNGEIKSIGHGAFIGCGSLTTINLPDSLETIGPHAFWNCSNLSSVIIPDKTATIGSAAFVYCEKLTDITFGSGLTRLDTWAVSWCDSLKEVAIPEGLTTIEAGGVFLENPALSKVEIPKSVSSITSNIFELSPKTHIYGIKGSYAQTYAQEYGIPFVEQGSEPGDDPTDEPGMGELTGFIGQDPEGNYFLYNKADFNNAYLAYQINPDLASAKMYQHFINQKCEIVALRDATKGYMDYSAAATACLLAQMKGQSFSIETYFGRSDAKLYGQTVNNVGNVAKDGSVTY